MHVLGERHCGVCMSVLGFFSVCNREIASKTLYKLLPFCVAPELTGVIGVVSVVDGVVITLRM